MTIDDILPGLGLGRLVRLFLEEAALSLARFRRGGAHYNAPPTESLSILNNVARLLRFALLILACHIELRPVRRRAPRSSSKRRIRLVAASFRLFPAFRVFSDDAGKLRPPPQFANSARDPLLAVERKRALLERVLADPIACVMRMARRLPKQLMVIGWRPPKRPPRRHRELAETVADAWREAWFQLREFRRRMVDNESAGASAS